jgi:hypothetical protein
VDELKASPVPFVELCPSSVFAILRSIQIVPDNMYLLARVLPRDILHEVNQSCCRPMGYHSAENLSGANIECPMALVLIFVAYFAPVLSSWVSPCQRLHRFFIDAQHDGVRRG